VSDGRSWQRLTEAGRSGQPIHQTAKEHIPMKKNTADFCESAVSSLQEIDDAADAARADHVASDLERITYEPLFLLPIDGFLRMRKDDVLCYARELCELADTEIARFSIRNIESPEKVIETQLRMLLRNFQLLARLRNDEPEAWDEIHELYEDD
jgi:hypothetical protein